MPLAIRLLAAALFASSCASISVIPRYGRSDLDGHVGMHGSGSASFGTNDLKDIGMEDDTSVPSGRVDLEVVGMHATFAISHSEHGGSGTLESSISDGTTTIPAGTAVDSVFDVTVGEAFVTWDLVPGDLVEVGIGLGATVFDLDAQFTAPGLSQTVGTQEALPVPLVALRGGLDFGRFDVSALLGGMQIDVGGDDVGFLDLDLISRLKIFGPPGRRIGGLVAGYRYVDLAAEYTDSGREVDAGVRLSGPYVGLSVGF